MKIGIDLHVHTIASKDSTLTFETLKDACTRRGLKGVAICDHNSVWGAYEARRVCERFDINVIIGEEILTSEGEIIGLFLNEEIPPHMPVLDTMAAIKGQRGLVYIPHPFDSFRSNVIKPGVLAAIADSAEVIEVFNARSWTSWGDSKASHFAASRGLSRGAGSDAHCKYEVGNGRVLMKPFDGADGFMRNLKEAKIEGKRTSRLLRVWLKVTKTRRGLMKGNFCS